MTFALLTSSYLLSSTSTLSNIHTIPIYTTPMTFQYLNILVLSASLGKPSISVLSSASHFYSKIPRW